MLTVSGVKLREDRDLIHEFVNFVLEKFVSKTRRDNAKIHLKVIDREDLPEDEQEEFAEAGAWMEYHGRSKGGKRLFTITISSDQIWGYHSQKARLKSFLHVLAHEMVHVKQYLNNELFDYKDGKRARFKGKLYAIPTSKTMDWAYYNSPWEVAAYGMSDGIYDMFYKLKDE